MVPHPTTKAGPNESTVATDAHQSDGDDSDDEDAIWRPWSNAPSETTRPLSQKSSLTGLRNRLIRPRSPAVDESPQRRRREPPTEEFNGAAYQRLMDLVCPSRSGCSPSPTDRQRNR